MNSLIKRDEKEEPLSYAEMDWNWEEIEKAINVLENKPGVPGPQGPQGPAGAKGDKGDTGAQGPAGAKGDKGDTGAQGPAGAKGDKGDTGAQGPAGAKGDKGDKGDTGDPGEPGIGLGGVIQIIDVNYPAAQPPAISTATIDLTDGGYIYRINVVSDLNIAYVDEPHDPGSVRTFEVHIVQGVTAYPVSFAFAPTWIGGDPPVLEAGLTSVVVFRIIDGNCVGNFAYNY